MKIYVTDPQGNEAELPALEGFRVMEIIRDWSVETGIGIRAECGGACACATCHVHVDDAWTDRLPQMRDDEDDRDESDSSGPGSGDDDEIEDDEEEEEDNSGSSGSGSGSDDDEVDD